MDLRIEFTTPRNPKTSLKKLYRAGPTTTTAQISGDLKQTGQFGSIRVTGQSCSRHVNPASSDSSEVEVSVSKLSEHDRLEQGD